MLNGAMSDTTVVNTVSPISRMETSVGDGWRESG
jgi:hypothetical protein